MADNKQNINININPVNQIKLAEQQKQAAETKQNQQMNLNQANNRITGKNSSSTLESSKFIEELNNSVSVKKILTSLEKIQENTDSDQLKTSLQSLQSALTLLINLFTKKQETNSSKQLIELFQKNSFFKNISDKIDNIELAIKTNLISEKTTSQTQTSTNVDLNSISQSFITKFDEIIQLIKDNKNSQSLDNIITKDDLNNYTPSLSEETANTISENISLSLAGFIEQIKDALSKLQITTTPVDFSELQNLEIFKQLNANIQTLIEKTSEKNININSSINMQAIEQTSKEIQKEVQETSKQQVENTTQNIILNLSQDISTKLSENNEHISDNSVFNISQDSLNDIKEILDSTANSLNLDQKKITKDDNSNQAKNIGVNINLTSKNNIATNKNNQTQQTDISAKEPEQQSFIQSELMYNSNNMHDMIDNTNNSLNYQQSQQLQSIKIISHPETYQQEQQQQSSISSELVYNSNSMYEMQKFPQQQYQEQPKLTNETLQSQKVQDTKDKSMTELTNKTVETQSYEQPKLEKQIDTSSFYKNSNLFYQQQRQPDIESSVSTQNDIDSAVSQLSNINMQIEASSIDINENFQNLNINTDNKSSFFSQDNIKSFLQLANSNNEEDLVNALNIINNQILVLTEKSNTNSMLNNIQLKILYSLKQKLQYKLQLIKQKDKIQKNIEALNKLNSMQVQQKKQKAIQAEPVSQQIPQDEIFSSEQHDMSSMDFSQDFMQSVQQNNDIPQMQDIPISQNSIDKKEQNFNKQQALQKFFQNTKFDNQLINDVYKKYFYSKLLNIQKTLIEQNGNAYALTQNDINNYGNIIAKQFKNALSNKNILVFDTNSNSTISLNQSDLLKPKKLEISSIASKLFTTPENLGQDKNKKTDEMSKVDTSGQSKLAGMELSTKNTEVKPPEFKQTPIEKTDNSKKQTSASSIIISKNIDNIKTKNRDDTNEYKFDQSPQIYDVQPKGNKDQYNEYVLKAKYNYIVEKHQFKEKQGKGIPKDFDKQSSEQWNNAYKNGNILSVDQKKTYSEANGQKLYVNKQNVDSVLDKYNADLIQKSKQQVQMTNKIMKLFDAISAMQVGSKGRLG